MSGEIRIPSYWLTMSCLHVQWSDFVLVDITWHWSSDWVEPSNWHIHKLCTIHDHSVVEWFPLSLRRNPSKIAAECSLRFTINYLTWICKKNTPLQESNAPLQKNNASLQKNNLHLKKSIAPLQKINAPLQRSNTTLPKNNAPLQKSNLHLKKKNRTLLHWSSILQWRLIVEMICCRRRECSTTVQTSGTSKVRTPQCRFDTWLQIFNMIEK